MTWVYNGKVLREGRPWTDDNGIQHPGNWNVWTAGEKSAHGLTEVIEQPIPDTRFYWVTQTPDGTVTAVEREIEDVLVSDETGKPVMDERTGKQAVTKGLKSYLINQVKQQQGSLLSQTDWAIIRKTDTGKEVPGNIQEWRNSIHATADAMEAAIKNAINLEAVKSLHVTHTTNDDGTVTKTGILFDWPTLKEPQ